MNAVTALVRKDLRVIYRDGFMVFIAAYALILALVARLGVGWVPINWQRTEISLRRSVAFFRRGRAAN